MKRCVITVGAFLALGWISRMDAQDRLFVPGTPVTIGGGIGNVGLFDLNRDGHLDLVSGLRNSGNLEVRLGDGRGRFLPLSGGPLDFGIKPAAIAFGDVNGDGVLDCGVASRDTTNEYIHVFIGSGDGRFRPTPGTRLIANRAISFYKPQLWFVDVNEDGRLDLIAQNGRRNTVEIFIGDGRGGFASAKVVKLDEGYNSYSAALGDINGDGHLDMAIAMSPLSVREQGKVTILRGVGSGEFLATSGTPLSVDTSPGLAALADVNGDTRLDIVLSHGERELLSVLLSEANGRFSRPLTFSLEAGMSAFTVVVADANRDKRPDLIVGTVNSVVRPSNSAVVVLLGSGSTFVPASGSPFPVGPGAYKLAAGDINEDGALDLVTSSFEGDAVRVLMGR